MLENLELLRLFVKGTDDPGIERILLREDHDGCSFAEFCQRHLLAGFLYSDPVYHRLKHLFPREIVEVFRRCYVRQWIRNESLMDEVERLGALFRHTGQEVIYLKGLFLAQRLYGSIGRRAIADLDILVRTVEDVEVVQRLLIEQGYQRISGVPVGRRVAFWFAHHFAYRRDSHLVELHWDLQRHFTFHIDAERIWGTKRSLVHDDETYDVLSDEYELVAQIISIFMDVQVGKIILKPLLDTYSILKRIGGNLDWAEYFERRRSEGLFLISLNVLDLVLHTWDCQDEFPDLAEYLEENHEDIELRNTKQKLDLLGPSLLGWNHKNWALRLYQTSMLNACCWWAMSLPFRMAVY